MKRYYFVAVAAQQVEVQTTKMQQWLIGFLKVELVNAARFMLNKSCIL